MTSLYTQMLQRVIDRGLSAELDAHLGYGRHAKAVDGARASTRNDMTPKRLKGTFGEFEVNTPRDRAGTFEPVLVKKRQTRLGDFEDKILALYARGMSTRDIESALVDLYGVTVSHDVIAQVPDAVLDEVRAWQERPLEAIYPVVWLDGQVLKVRHGKQGDPSLRACHAGPEPSRREGSAGRVDRRERGGRSSGPACSAS